MRPIRSAVATALASTLLASSLTGCQFGSDSTAGGEIVIAADLELSGAAAAVGKGYQRALELSVEQINESGLLGGRTIRLDVRDNRSDPSESLRNIGDFTSNSQVTAIIMGSCSDCAVGAARTLNDKRVPTISLAPATAVATPVAERRYVFKLGPNAADSAATIANELRRRGIRQASLLHTDDEYGKDGLRVMSAELDKLDIDLVASKQVRTTDTDVSQAVSALAEPEDDDEDPGALLVWTSAEQAVLAADSAAQVDYPGPVFFDAAAAGDLFLTGGSANGAEGVNLVFTQTMVIDDVIANTPAKAARKQWFRDYTARFGSYYGFSSFAADAVQLIAEAVALSGGETVDREAIREVLETTQLDGLSGPIRMTPDNHSGLMPQALTMLVFRGGRWRLAS
ncbi:ABC transporter substrate-binding protein [Solwaraspora sp. WMMA2056]|uniref:ABC transporter substrate-binding protein n=1 Tax=Solwaraspora sp. WMMA2056 TaxID=3015161 RepID=UPI00259B8159|nr:ABC transporter substrate-binding protein [Solwaraspora sp. WMMA2056]WJK42323.1 ABC transporter substrate-binding protein [Solwaraspora sp. WMMA2056]